MMFGFGKNKKQKRRQDNGKEPFYIKAMEICFHPIYTQTPCIYLMTQDAATREMFLAFILASMDVYFDRYDDPAAAQQRKANTANIAAFLTDREAVLQNPEKRRSLEEGIDALFEKVMQTGEALSTDEKLNMILYNAKAFLGLERRYKKRERLRAAWEDVAAAYERGDAQEYSKEMQEDGR